MSLNNIADLYPNTLSGLSSFNANQILINGVDISTIYVPFINSPSDVDLADKNFTTSGRVQTAVLKLPSATYSTTKVLRVNATKEVESVDLAPIYVSYINPVSSLDMGSLRIFTTAFPVSGNEVVNKDYTDGTYPTFGFVSTNYLTIANASAIYLTQADASSTYLTITTASGTYLTIANASSTYLTIANASSTYLTIANASSTYLTQSNASTTYQTQAGMPSFNFTGTPTIASAPSATDDSDKIPTTHWVTYAMSLVYLPIATASATYLTITNASTTYATITNLNLKANSASPTFTGTVTLPSTVIFTTNPASGTGTLLAIDGSGNLVTTTSSALNQTATSTNATYYLTFVASSSTGTFTPLVYSQIMCNPNIGLIEVNNIKVTSRNQGGSQVSLLGRDSAGNVIDGVMTQTASTANTNFPVGFIQSSGTGLFTPLNETSGAFTFNPSTLNLKTSKLQITSVPTGTQTFLLAVDSAGNVIQGTGGGGVPTQINPTPINTSTTLYPVFLTSTAGGTSTTYVESDGSLFYNPSTNRFTVPIVSASSVVETSAIQNSSGQIININAQGGAIAGNRLNLQIQSTTYYYFDKDAFYLTQPVNNVISSITNDLYVLWPSAKILSLNNWVQIDNTGLLMAGTRSVITQNIATQATTDLNLNVPTATNFIDFNFNGLTRAAATDQGLWLPVDGTRSIYMTDTAPRTGTTTYGRFFGVGGTIYQDFYNQFMWRAMNLAGNAGINIMYLRNSGLNINKSTNTHATLNDYELVVGDNLASNDYSGKILIRGQTVTALKGPSVDFTSFASHTTPQASIEVVDNGAWGGIFKFYVKKTSAGAAGALYNIANISDDLGLQLMPATGSVGGAPRLNFSGAAAAINADVAGYNWYIGGTQIGYFDYPSSNWRISTNGSQKLILCSGSQNTLQCGNGGLGQYPVEIYGYRVVYGSYWQYTGGGLNWGVQTRDFNIGLYVQYTVSADGGYLLASDERIKKDIKPAESGSLEVISTIPIKSHSYIDSFVNGCPTAFNVIAQDIERTYPEAITKGDGFIPDMFVKCNWIHVDEKQIEINIPKPHTVKAGDKVKLILEDDSSKESIVMSIKNETTFIVEKWDEFKLEISDELFVYGKQIDDFLRVDKIKLGILGLAGVKELHQIVKLQQAKIEEQSQAINTLTESMKMLTEHLATLTTAFNKIVKE